MPHGILLRNSIKRTQSFRDPSLGLFETHNLGVVDTNVATTNIFPNRKKPVTFSTIIEITELAPTGLIFEFGDTTRGIKLGLEDTKIQFVAGDGSGGTEESSGDLTIATIEASVVITSSSVADPTNILAVDHGKLTGDRVEIVGHTSTPDINGFWIVTRIDDDNYTIPIEVTGGGTGGTSETPGYRYKIVYAVNPGDGESRLWVNGLLKVRAVPNPASALEGGEWSSNGAGSVASDEQGTSNPGTTDAITSAPSGFSLVAPLKVFMGQLPRQFNDTLSTTF